MKKYQVVWTDMAEYDRENIYRYIAKESFAPEAAKKLINTFEKEAERLSLWPHRTIVHKKLGYCRLIINKKYNMYYSIDETQKIVYIERIIHGRRSQRQALRP